MTTDILVRVVYEISVGIVDAHREHCVACPKKCTARDLRSRRRRSRPVSSGSRHPALSILDLHWREVVPRHNKQARVGTS